MCKKSEYDNEFGKMITPLSGVSSAAKLVSSDFVTGDDT